MPKNWRKLWHFLAKIEKKRSHSDFSIALHILNVVIVSVDSPGCVCEYNNKTLVISAS